MLLTATPARALTAVQVAKLQPGELDPDDQLAGSVSVDGETIVMSSPGFSQFFTKGDTTDFLGGAVAIDGDTAGVGAFFDDPSGFGSGSAYVYARQDPAGLPGSVPVPARDTFRVDRRRGASRVVR